MSMLFLNKKKSEKFLEDPKKPVKVETKGILPPKLNLNFERNVDVLEGIENIEIIETNEEQTRLQKTMKALKQLTESSEQDLIMFQNLKYYYMTTKVENEKLQNQNNILLHQIDILKDESKLLKEENEQLKISLAKKKLEKSGNKNKNCSLM